MSLYETIGKTKIHSIVKIFYEKCAMDPMLSHFFWNLDHDHLVGMQVDFVSNLLGGPKNYQGQSLQQAHRGFAIRPPHFMRRQRILAETMNEQGLDPALAKSWLELEDRLRLLIVNHPSR